MYREAQQFLLQWKVSDRRKPLIIRGARQVGKTWLMQWFGQAEYDNVAYINFDGNDRMAQLFSGDLDIERICSGLEIEADTTITPGKTLLIFDEVQEVPRALTSLKYFCENAPEHHVVAAGSLLGVALHPGTPFPVGKVSFLELFPLSFMEFLKAVGQERFADRCERQEWDLINTFSGKYIELLKQYYYVGGMPEVVAAFQERRDVKMARDIQLRILASFEQDFSKHAPPQVVPRIRMLWNAIPSQLSKENRKFVYGLIKKGSRARDYEMAIAWLADCGLIHKVTRVTKPGMPLGAYEDLKAFKLFMLDVGLLGAMTLLDPKVLLNGHDVFTEFKGSLTEQYVLQELKAGFKIPVHYWSHDRGLAEIDFVIQCENKIVPMEVKAEINLRAKSLRAYRDRYNPPLAIRTSLADYRVDEGLANIPLYALQGLDRVVAAES
jgi:predicted AAA+ superfamily ATPase